MPDIDLSQYYTSKEAAMVLSRNSGKRITPNYVRLLVTYGKINQVKINDRFSVYPRGEIDSYVVKDPGVKSGEASKKRSEKRKEEKE